MTQHKAGSSAVFNIALEREGKKRSYLYTTWGIRIKVTHPGANPAEQGLTLLSVVLSLWYSDSQLGKWIILNNDNFDATNLRL